MYKYYELIYYLNRVGEGFFPTELENEIGAGL